MSLLFNFDISCSRIYCEEKKPEGIRDKVWLTTQTRQMSFLNKKFSYFSYLSSPFIFSKKKGYREVFFTKFFFYVFCYQNDIWEYAMFNSSILIPFFIAFSIQDMLTIHVRIAMKMFENYKCWVFWMNFSSI